MLPVEKRNFGAVVPPVKEKPFTASQADGLKFLKKRTARVIAVTSGKGGVGKTNLAVNLSIALARKMRKVILVDLDLGLANVDILMKLEARYNLSHVISGRRTLREVIQATDTGVYVVPGASGVEDIANLDDTRRTVLVESFRELTTLSDYVVFDTQAGISRNTVEFVAAADEIVIVTTPEPTAVLDAFAMIKLIAREIERGNLLLVVNQARSAAEGERVASGVALTARKLLNAHVERLGVIPADEGVVRAVKANQPFLLAAPYGPASMSVKAISDRFYQGVGTPAEGKNFVQRLLGLFRK